MVCFCWVCVLPRSSSRKQGGCLLFLGGEHPETKNTSFLGGTSGEKRVVGPLDVLFKPLEGELTKTSHTHK